MQEKPQYGPKTAPWEGSSVQKGSDRFALGFSERRISRTMESRCGFWPLRTLPLFTYLLLGRDRPIARDQLAYKFWPDTSEIEARANLRRHMHRIIGPLHEISEHRWIEAKDKVIAFDRRMPLDLDVARLEAACLSPADAAGAVDLYTSELFEGCDEDWLVPHREGLRTAYLHPIFGLIDRYRGERGFPKRIALLRSI